MSNPKSAHAQYQTHSQDTQTGGVPCPSCDTFIPMTLQDLLSNKSFCCPNRDCRTRLRLDSRGSSSTLAALRSYKDRMKEIQANLG